MASGPDKTGVEIVDKIAAYGYDYIELPLGEMMELDGETFQNIKARVKESGLRCEVCNNFFPAKVRLTGPDVDRDQVRAYYQAALERAAQLGVSVIVFGSAGAKRVPEGFSHQQAFQQVVDITRELAPIAAEKEITIAIEPVRMPDCNIINTFEEGVQLAKCVSQPNVKVLIDFYHMVCEHESPQVLMHYGREYLCHVHFSYPNIPLLDGRREPDAIRHLFEKQLDEKGWWRTYPSKEDEWEYAPFIKALKQCGYNGRVSLEAPVQDFEKQAPKALAFLKEFF